VIFQTYKNVVLRNVHSFGWLLWLCFCPKGFFKNHQFFYILVEVEVGESDFKNQFNDQDEDLVAMEGKPKNLPQFELD